MVNSQAVNGISNLELNYSFVDVNPKQGQNYYRLRQIDLDGKSTYSKEIDLVGTSNGSVTNVYPNPAKDKVALQLPADKVGIAGTINLYSMNGTLMQSNTFNATESEISLSDLKSGLYLYKVILDNGTQYSGKVVKE
jgi:hypothetical protein